MPLLTPIASLYISTAGMCCRWISPWITSIAMCLPTTTCISCCPIYNHTVGYLCHQFSLHLPLLTCHRLVTVCLCLIRHHLGWGGVSSPSPTPGGSTPPEISSAPVTTCPCLVCRSPGGSFWLSLDLSPVRGLFSPSGSPSPLSHQRLLLTTAQWLVSIAIYLHRSIFSLTLHNGILF